MLFNFPKKLFNINITAVSAVKKTQEPAQQNGILIMKTDGKFVQHCENLISIEKAQEKRKLYVHLLKPFTKDTPYIDTQNHLVLPEDVRKADEQIHYNLAHGLMEPTGSNIGHEEGKRGWTWLYDTFYDDSHNGIEIQKAHGIPEDKCYPHALTGIMYVTDEGMKALKSGEFSGAASIQGESLSKAVNPYEYLKDSIYKSIERPIQEIIDEKIENHDVNTLEKIEKAIYDYEDVSKIEIEKSLPGFKAYIQGLFKDFHKVYKKRGDSMSDSAKIEYAKGNTYDVMMSQFRDSIQEIIPEVISKAVDKSLPEAIEKAVTEEAIEKAIEKKMDNIVETVTEKIKLNKAEEKKNQEANQEKEAVNHIKELSDKLNATLEILNKATGVPNSSYEQVQANSQNNGTPQKGFYQSLLEKEQEQRKNN